MKKRVTGLLLALCLCLTLLPGTAGAAYEQPTKVSKVTLGVTPPAVGGALTAPTVDSNEPYFIDSDALFDDRFADTFYWNRVAAEGCDAVAGYLYEEGGTSLVNDSWYQLHARLKLDYGYSFAEQVTAAVVGAASTEVERYRDDTVYVSAWFKVGNPPETPTTISTVTLTGVPTERAETIEAWTDAIQEAAVSEGCRIYYASLREWDSKDSQWHYSDSSGSTDAGKVYGAMLTINPLPDHVFADTVTATVNDSAAEVAECDIDEVVVFVPFGNVTIDKVEVKSATWPIDGNTIRKDADNFYLNDYFSDGSYPYTLKSAQFQIKDGDSYRDLRDEETIFSGYNNYRVIAELEAKDYASFADSVTGNFNGTSGTECQTSNGGKTCTVTRTCAVYDRIYTYSDNEPDNHINSVTIHQNDPQPGKKYADGEYAPSGGSKTKLVGIDTGTSYYSWDEVPCVGSTESLKKLTTADAFEAGKVYWYRLTLRNADSYRFSDGFTVSFAQPDGSKSNYAMIRCETDTEKWKVYNLWYTVGDVTQTPITRVAVTGPAYQNGTVDIGDPDAFRADAPVTLRSLTYNNDYLSFTLLPQSGHYFGRTVSVTYNGKEARVSDGFFSSFDTKYIGVSYSGEPVTPVTVTDIAAESKTYDGTAAATLTGGTLVGVMDGHDVALDLSGVTAVFADQNAGTGKTVSVTGQFRLAGRDADKYTLTQPTLDLTADIAVCPEFTDATSKTQAIYVGESSFEAPKFTGIGGEEVTGTLRYTLADGKTDADIPEMLRGLKAGESLNIPYTFTASGNYSGEKTGTITVTAQDRPVPAPSGSVRYEVAVAKADHGAVSASAARAAAGDTVTLTVQPDSGYVLAALTVTDSQGREVKLTRLDGGKYSFTMPGSRVEVQAVFAGITFSDVPGGAYYEEAVRWAVEKGVTTGTTATTFSPSAPCTRAQLAAFLWRLAGEPESTRDLTFTDVRADAWCAKALRWAAEQGVVTGYADGSFRPDQTVTRIQAVAMLYRYARAQGMDTTQGGMAVREFDDFAAVPTYALEAAGWAVNAGILRGAGNRLMPNDPCTRAQIVTFLYRAMQGK